MLRGRAWPALLLVAAAVAAHGVSLRNGFVWDDKSIVVEGAAQRTFAGVMLSPDEMKPYYRPLTRASFVLDYRLFGLDPRAYHLGNLLPHVAAALLLYLLGLRLFKSRAPALAAALLLAVHPIHSEAVAFVSARNNIYALCFGIASLLLFIDKRAALSALAFLCAALSKEPGVMVLPVLALWTFAKKERWTLLLLHFAALGGYFVVRTISLGAPVASDGVMAGLWSRLAQNYWVLPRYLLLAIFPGPLGPYHEVPKNYATLWWLPLAWLAMIAAVVFIVRRPTPASALGLAWFVVNLAPILNVVPIPSTAMAERFFYIPAAGLWLVVADLLWRSPVPRRVLVAAGAAAVIALGVRSSLRDGDWHDDVALFRSAVAAEPASVKARFNYGTAFKEAGDLDAAKREWEAALAIAPEDAETHAQLGTFFAVRGDYRSAEEHYRIALRGDWSLTEVHKNLAKICERTGRPDEARLHAQAAGDK